MIISKELLTAALKEGQKRYAEEHWDTDKTELEFMADSVHKLLQAYDTLKPATELTGSL